MLRQILSTLGLFASVLAFLIGAAIAVSIVLLRPELGPGLKNVRIARAPDAPLLETVSASEPLRRLLLARARKAEAAKEALRADKSKPSLAKAAVAWPQEQASRRGLASLSRERAERRLAKLPKRRLDLGANQKHHTAVAEAAMLTGLSPAAIAALIDAEARKTRKGEWDPQSSNPTSSAEGMAQFLEKTWLEQARNSSRFLHREARRRGLIDAGGSIRTASAAQRTAKDKPARKAAKLTTRTIDGAPRPSGADALQVAAMASLDGPSAAQIKPGDAASATGGTAAEKAAAAGTSTPDKSPQKKPVAKKKTLSPAQTEARNLKKLLDMRLEPRVAIIAAAELAADNLLALARSGYAPQDDEAAAKLAYLAHHEGLSGARAHLAGVVNRSRAEKRLKANISDERAERLLHAHDGKPHRAYAAWLEDYIAKRIRPERFHSEID